jgi:hypothetical protein
MPALTATQVIEFIDKRFGDLQIPDTLDEHNAVGAARAYRLRRIGEFLSQSGFPRSKDDRCRLSLLPFINREAIYYDIDWMDQHADLVHLSDLYFLDYLVFSGGTPRLEASTSDFRAYLGTYNACAERWRNGEFRFWLD